MFDGNVESGDAGQDGGGEKDRGPAVLANKGNVSGRRRFPKERNNASVAMLKLLSILRVKVSACQKQFSPPHILPPSTH